MIVFDLDGTLANCEHRRHLVDRGHPINEDRRLNEIKLVSTPQPDIDPYIWQPNWPAFYDACDKDEPIFPTIKIFKHMYAHEGVQIWSGRCESVRSKTIDWLEKHLEMELDSWFLKNRLKMRPMHSGTPDDILKEEWLDKIIAAGGSIECVFDDRPKVVRMWRRRGIFVFNCLQNDKEF